MYFRFRQAKQFLDNVPMNRQKTGNCSALFRIIFVFCVMEEDSDKRKDRDGKGDGDLEEDVHVKMHGETEIAEGWR